MARFDGAVIREQGVEFAIAVVRRLVLNNPSQRDQAQTEFASLFGLPTVLMAQDAQGTPTYYGRPDLVKFLASVPVGAIPWRSYSLN
jgi:hypothetical protein